MAGATEDFSSALEDCLNAIGLGEELGVCLARYPTHAEKLRPYLEAVIQMRQSSYPERQALIDIPAVIPFNAALNHSIQMIMRGKTPEHCYSQYPEHAAELKPWLTAVVDVRDHGAVGTVTEREFPGDLLTPQVTFSEALEYCLDALERGIQPEVALSRYPYYADRLRIWVYYVASLQSRINLKPQKRSVEPLPRQNWVERVRLGSHVYRFSNLAMSLLLAIFFVASGARLVHASADTLPGQSLYVIKRGWEQVQLAIVPEAQQEALNQQFNEARLGETLELIENNKVADVEFQGVVTAVDVNSVEINNIVTVFTGPGVNLPALKAGVTVYVKGSTNGNGVSADDVVVNSAPSQNPPVSVVLPPTVIIPTATRTAFPTFTPTRWLSPTSTLKLSSPTSTNQPTNQPSATYTSSPTSTLTFTPTFTLTFTPTFTSTFTPTYTPTFTATWTSTSTPSDTPTPVPTNTPTPLPTKTSTPVPTNTSTPEPTNTPTPLPTNTPTPLPTNTPVPSPTNTPVPSSTNTPIPLPTNTSNPVPTASPTDNLFAPPPDVSNLGVVDSP